MKKGKALSLATVLALVMALALSAIPSHGVKAESTKGELLFTKVKTTIFLTDNGGLFELLKKDVSNWRVNVTFKVTVENNTPEKLYISGAPVEMTGESSISIKPGKKKTVTISGLSTIGEILQHSVPSEAQVLKLLNGKSVTVKTSPIKLRFKVNSAVWNGEAPDYIGDYTLTVISGDVDVVH